MIERASDPTQPPSPDARAARARTVAARYVAIALVACLGFATRYALAGHTWLAAPNVVSALVLAPLLVAIRRTHDERAVPALLQIGSGTVVLDLVIASAVSGGPMAPAIFWLIGVPVGVTHALGARLGLRWVVICLAALLVISLSAFVPGLPSYPMGPVEYLGTVVPLLLAVHHFAAAAARAREAEATLANQRAALAEREAEVNRQSRDAAVALARAKDDLFAMISHEMRSPLHAMLGLNALLAGSSLDAEQRSLVADVSASGDTLLALINDLLDYSRLEAGHMTLDAHPFDVRAAIDRALGVVAPMASDKPLILVGRVDEAVPEEIDGDELRFRQVLVNLLGNAVKFTERGRVSLRAGVRGSGADQRLVVTVEDTGVGIPADKLAHIFEPFVQADASTSRRFGGTGLGLSITRRIAEAMGGSVTVTSEEGEGSRFTLELPCEAADAPAEERGPLAGKTVALAIDDAEERLAARSLCQRMGLRERGEALADCVIADRESASTTDVRALGERVVWIDHAGDPAGPVARRPLRAHTLEAALRAALGLPEDPAHGAARTSRAGRSLRVLLVDDTPVNLTVGRKMLEALGHEVVTVASGREALERLEAERFDVVLLDLRMPEIDGPRVARTFRAAHPSRPEIIIGMSADAGATSTAMEAGMAAFLTKPTSIDELARALRHVSRERRSSEPEPPAPVLDEPRPLESLRKLNVPEEEISRLVSAFVRDARSYAEAALTAAEQLDRETAARCAHSLRGSAPMFGVVGCADAARRLEDDAGAAPPEELTRMARELLTACEADARVLAASVDGGEGR